MDGLVIDSSVSVSWCFPDEQASYAMEVLKSLASHKSVVPSLWPLETANVFLVGERRKRSTEANTATWTAFLDSLPIEIDTETTNRAFGDTLNIARTHNLSVYDAAYLELAMRRGFPLATLDDKLKAAAGTVGVPLFDPAA